MKKEKIKYLLLFFFSFLFCFIIFGMCQGIYCDEVWLYGFSYNLSKGMMIYRDYNVVTTPLYFFLVNIFIKIFGNYIIVMHIFDSLLFATIIMLLFKIINWKSLILLPIFMFWWPSGYNLLCLFLLTLIIYLIHEKKDKDWLIALIIGLILITKQNIGVMLFIPCLYYSKNKIKTIITFLIPFFIVSIYLIFNNAFFDFINYCFLGLLEFGESNKYIEFPFFISTILTIGILLYLLIKNKLKNKELFYILMFQIMVYPIFDLRHYLCAFFPVMYLILKKINNKRPAFFIGFAVYLFFILLFSFQTYKIDFSTSNITYLRKKVN